MGASPLIQNNSSLFVKLTPILKSEVHHLLVDLGQDNYELNNICNVVVVLLNAHGLLYLIYVLISQQQ